MSESKVLSFAELVDCPDNDVNFLMVETRRGTVKIAEGTSEGILDWFTDNDARLEDGSADLEKRRYRGLRLVVRCIMNPDGTRIPKEQLGAALELMKKRNTRDNSALVEAAMKVNGFVLEPKGPAPKNDSSEPSGASPTDSPLQPGA